MTKKFIITFRGRPHEPATLAGQSILGPLDPPDHVGRFPNVSGHVYRDHRNSHRMQANRIRGGTTREIKYGAKSQSSLDGPKSAGN